MQHPTCTDTRIRSTQDAHKIFFAVQHGILPLVTRRLDADERLALRSGCVYAWEERGAHSEITGLGIERFTEGRRWSPSRVRDEFLFYYEKYTPPHDASQPNSQDRPAPRDWDPLVKQTYSVWVETPNGRRKWHLTAYFTQATVDQLGTINDLQGVGSLFVPEGLFQSTRTGKNRKADPESSRTKDVLHATAGSANTTRKYAAFPSSSSYSAPSDSHSGSERYHASSVGQGSQQYYNPDAQLPIAHYPAQSPAYGLPPLESTAYHNDRRGSFADEHNAVASRYGDPQYSAIATSPTSHQHGPFRERSMTRESHGSTHSAGPSPTEDSAAWAYSPPPISSNSYTLRPSFATTPATTTAYVPSPPPYTLDHDGFTYSRSTPSSDRTSPSLTNSTPSSHEYGLPDERVAYDTTSSVRTKFDGDHDADAPSRVKLAPLHSLRNHPYRRDPVDDRALRKLRPRAP
ncbi:hypothetical protein FIBSPDRAFT_846547 [Athelia psychrophila]|uniref:cAMP-independent regulatory protein pac2 n=1 Tax=Athelia psychrophila TaxID=1759441 RepID=A0A166X4W3_9AGAM|nr:hypothetical protein FIBSPDRAFT_846547 [Fibularhizoctonia sp. CBS 109695]